MTTGVHVVVAPEAGRAGPRRAGPRLLAAGDALEHQLTVCFITETEPKVINSALEAALRAYPRTAGSGTTPGPDGALVEEYIDGVDTALGYIDGVGHDNGG